MADGSKVLTWAQFGILLAVFFAIVGAGLTVTYNSAVSEAKDVEECAKGVETDLKKHLEDYHQLHGDVREIKTRQDTFLETYQRDRIEQRQINDKILEKLEEIKNGR